MNRYIELFLSAFCISFLLTPLVRKIALRLNFVSFPKDDRWHKNPTAIFGGVAIFLAVIIPLIYIFGFSNRQIIGFLIGSSIIFICGIIDDLKKLPPQVKILFQIIASCIVVYFGILIKPNPDYLALLPQALSKPIDLLIFPVTILWIIGITNAFNLLDNMDGLCAGIAGITSIMLFSSGILIGNITIPFLAVVLAGACLGFIPFNFNPAKIFMGDSGSMFLGFAISSVALMGTSARTFSNILVTLAVPVLILAVPIFDTALVTFMRSINGRSILQGGKDHASHRLVSLGLSEKKTVLLLYAISIIFGSVALAYSRLNILVVTVLVTLVIVVLVFFGMFLSEVKTYSNEREIEAARRKKISEGKVILNTLLLYKAQIATIIIDFLLICIAYYSAYLLRFDGIISDHNYNLLKTSLPWIIVIKLAVFYYFSLYRGMRHFTSVSDFISVFKAVGGGSVLSILFITFIFRFKDHSRVVFIIDWLLTLLFIAFSRFMFRFLEEYFQQYRPGRKILIFGAGACGELFLREIKSNKNLNYKPVGFIDDDKKKKGKQIHGVKILGARQDLAYYVKESRAEEVIIAVPSLKKEDCKDIVEACASLKIPCRSLAKIMDTEKWA